MRKITIIPSDKLVIINGEAIRFDFTIDDNIHAVQWEGNSGIVETKKGDNIKLKNMDMFQDIIDEHAKQLTIIAEERIKAEREAKLPINIWKSKMRDSDVLLPRIAEDLIDVQLNKGLITLQDLPKFVRDNYKKKKDIRNNKPD